MTTLVELPDVIVTKGSLGGARGAREIRPTSDVDVLAVPIAPAGEHSELQPRVGTADAAALYGIDLAEWAETSGLTGAAGESAVLALPRLLHGEAAWGDLPRRLALVGVGDASPDALRRAGAALASIASGVARVVTTVGLDDPGRDAASVRALVEGYWLAAYRAPRTARTAGKAKPVGTLELLTPAAAAAQSAVDAARPAAEAATFARLLAATPSNVKNPQWVAEQARAAVADVPTLAVEVRDADWLADHGFGALLAVGGGSATPPLLVTVTYEPETTSSASRSVVLAGKGITYDTGGLAIKPRESMVPMKTDMTGAGVVLAVVVAAARAGLRHRVTAVLPLAENAFGASSYRPGDVVTTYDGTSVEILNTDAEGRMVLADAMSWAASELDPDILVDVATLTGAATLGLGKKHGALYANDDRLAETLLAAGEASGEPLWRMPLVEDYRGALASSVADVAHIATDAHVGGGSITAALFLERFAGSGRWAHLDIAGPARSPKARHEIPEGATGFGARVLLRWLEQLR